MNNEESTKNGEGSESELLDFDNPTYTFTPNDSHDWRQKGPYLVCKSCEIEHATYIGMEKIMVGINKKGMPILKER